MLQDQLKEKAAHRALELLEPELDKHTILGIGTGSTTDYFIDALANVKARFDGAVASSKRSADRLQSHGIPVYDLNSVPLLSFYIDGADEANDQCQLIKGGGGALTREKIVAAVARQFICIVDDSKRVRHLGAFPLPLEVIPSARSYVAREIVKLGGNPVYRADFVTDNGNIILDLYDFSIPQPIATEKALNNIVGVVSNGIFAQRPADLLLVAAPDGITTVASEDAPGGKPLTPYGR